MLCNSRHYTPGRRSFNGTILRESGKAWRLVLAVGIYFASVLPACAEKAPTLTIRSSHHACHNAVVRFALPAEWRQRLLGNSGEGLVLERKGKGNREWLPCQADLENGQAVVTFVLPELAAGETQVYRLRRIQAPLAQGVRVTHQGETVEVSLGPALFTRYGMTQGANKPCFFPMLTPNGNAITRRWPMENVPGESHDHPHHRGLWFTHGSVNGVDFWSEGRGTGTTITTAIEGITGGPLYGGFQARTEWRAPDGKLLATDMREFRIYPLPDGARLLDFAITLTPAGGPLVFGDTKEGTFGLRLADSLALTGKQGAHILTSSGQKDGNAWGKPADWVDDYGPLDGQTYGVAIFDHPGNLRHPPGWHARDYGLFAVNPFCRSDFHLGLKGSGDYTLPPGQTLTFRYRVLFHPGDTTAARVADQYATYADPPEVQLRF